MNPAAPAPATNADPSQFGNYSQWAQQEMAKGFSPDQLHQSLQQSGVSVAAPHSGNWLTHLLPTIGSVAAPVIGGLLAPETGGLSLLAAAGLSGAGAAGGKAVENATEGKDPLQANDLTAGAEGLAGGAAGGVAGKALGKGAELLAGRAGGITDAAVNTAADTTQAADKLATSKTMNAIYGGSKNDVGAAQGMADAAKLDMTNPAQLQDAGQQMVSNGGQVLDDIVGNNKIPISGAIDQNGGKVAPSIDDLIHSSLTNTNPLTGEKLGASRSPVLGGLGPGQTDEDLLRNGYTRFLSSSAKNGTNTPATGFLNEANQLLSNVNHGSTADAHDLLDAQRLVGDKAYTMSQAAAKPSATEVTQAQAAAWKDLNHNLQDMIFSHPDVSNAATAMQGTHTAADFGGNQDLANLFNSRVTGAQSGKDINSLMHDSYNLRNVGQDGLETVSNPASSGNLALSRQEVAANAPDSGAAQPTLMDAAPHVLGGGGILNTAVKGAVHASQNPAILNTLSRIGGLASKLAPAAGSAIVTSPNLAADPTAMAGGAGVGGTMGGTMNNTNGMTAGGTVDPNSLQGILAKYMQMGTADPYLLSSTSPVVQALAPAVQKQNLLGSELNTLPSSYANAGGAQGLGGILSHLTGMIPGTGANTYEGQAAAVAQQLSATLGISPQAAMSLVPKLMQGGQSAGLTQGILGSMQGQLAPNGV
jgi:hypothetical protein